MNIMHRIDTPMDAFRMAESVFSLIWCTKKAEEFIIDDIKNLVVNYQNGLKSGWCYENAMFLHLFLNNYNRPSCLYNYGIKNTRFTHAIVLVEFKEEYYPIDPYFCRCYTDGSNILTIKQLFEKIKLKDFDSITTLYGTGVKKAYLNDQTTEFTGKDFADQIMKDWVDNFDYNNIMLKEFGHTHHLELMTIKIEKVRILRKGSGELYYEFF
jgi:hypothetical protein